MTPQQHIDHARRKRRHLLAHIDEDTLQILEEHFQTHLPAYQRSASGSYDPIAAAIRDGQREVILYLRHQLQLARQENTND